MFLALDLDLRIDSDHFAGLAYRLPVKPNLSFHKSSRALARGLRQGLLKKQLIDSFLITTLCFYKFLAQPDKSPVRQGRIFPEVSFGTRALRIVIDTDSHYRRRRYAASLRHSSTAEPNPPARTFSSQL